MTDNGLKTFAIHGKDQEQSRTLAVIDNEIERADSARSLTFEPETLDPETVARRYLNQMIASPAVPTLTAAGPGEEDAEYRTIGTETIPLTGTKVVKFAQCFYKIPVYGSLVTVELDHDNSFLAINSALGDPTGIDPVAKISPAQAQEVIHKDAGGSALPLAEPPRLYYYYDNWAEPHKWRLVYIAQNVRRDEIPANGETVVPLPELADYVIDAHTDELLARLPRVQSVTWNTIEEDAQDALGVPRRIRLQEDSSGNRRLSDTVLNVHTHDFTFQNVDRLGVRLPGNLISNPPNPWDGAAISAHANAAEVAEFLVTVLRRNGLDNRGGPFVSSINCTARSNDPHNKEWRNAAWIGTQMIYGQRMVNGKMRSYALAKDVVAHEITHGITDKTARLEYATMSGALNESYSDIFGVIISNIHESNVGKWNWEMGEELDVTGVPLRDISDPTKRGQPAHMKDFRQLGPGETPHPIRNDSGFVHHNSGIHNKAAYNLATSKNPTGEYTFTPQQVAALFYLALTQHLSRTSSFSDSRRGVELAAQTLFRNDATTARVRMLAAIAKAFDDVGIAA